MRSPAPAKPLWSEVMIFCDLFLRQETPYRRKSPAPMRKVLVGRRCGAGEVNSGERMLAGGGSVVGGRTPAKPLWSEVIVFCDVFLRRETPHRRYCCFSNSSSGRQPLHRSNPVWERPSRDQLLTICERNRTNEKGRSFFHWVKWQFEERICYTFIIK